MRSPAAAPAHLRMHVCQETTPYHMTPRMHHLLLMLKQAAGSWASCKQGYKQYSYFAALTSMNVLWCAEYSAQHCSEPLNHI